MLLLSHALTMSPAKGLMLGLTQTLSLSLSQALILSLPEALTLVLNKALIFSVTKFFTLSLGHFLTRFLAFTLTLSRVNILPLMLTKDVMLCLPQALNLVPRPLDCPSLGSMPLSSQCSVTTVITMLHALIITMPHEHCHLNAP